MAGDSMFQSGPAQPQSPMQMPMQMPRYQNSGLSRFGANFQPYRMQPYMPPTFKPQALPALVALIQQQQQLTTPASSGWNRDGIDINSSGP
jgi:hypothetical protein